MHWLASTSNNENKSSTCGLDSVVSNLLASLCHTGRRRVVLGHTLWYVITHKKSLVLSKSTILCWAVGWTPLYVNTQQIQRVSSGPGLGRQKTTALILVLFLSWTSHLTIVDLTFLLLKRTLPIFLPGLILHVHDHQLSVASFLFLSWDNWLFYWICYLATIFMWILEVPVVYTNIVQMSGRKILWLASFQFSLCLIICCRADF